MSADAQTIYTNALEALVTALQHEREEHKRTAALIAKAKEDAAAATNRRINAEFNMRQAKMVTAMEAEAAQKAAKEATAAVAAAPEQSQFASFVTECLVKEEGAELNVVEAHFIYKEWARHCGKKLLAKPCFISMLLKQFGPPIDASRKSLAGVHIKAEGEEDLPL